METDEKLMLWLLEGETGLSSKDIVRAYLGFEPKSAWGQGYYYPHDPSDLRRCVMLLDAVPEIRKNAFEALECEDNSPWPEYVKQWDELVALLREEMEEGKAHNHSRAPRTYARMREIQGEY